MLRTAAAQEPGDGRTEHRHHRRSGECAPGSGRRRSHRARRATPRRAHPRFPTPRAGDGCKCRSSRDCVIARRAGAEATPHRPLSRRRHSRPVEADPLSEQNRPRGRRRIAAAGRLLFATRCTHDPHERRHRRGNRPTAEIAERSLDGLLGTVGRRQIIALERDSTRPRLARQPGQRCESERPAYDHDGGTDPPRKRRLGGRYARRTATATMGHAARRSRRVFSRVRTVHCALQIPGLLAHSRSRLRRQGRLDAPLPQRRRYISYLGMFKGLEA